MRTTKLFVITPQGGADNELQRTCESVQHIQGARHIEVLHIIVFNNFANVDVDLSVTYNIERINISPIASRSRARNAGIEYIEELGPQKAFCIFLDSGDQILPGCVSAIEDTEKNSCIWGNSIISNGQKFYLKRRLPISLIELINPFFLSSVVIPTNKLSGKRFPLGRKEDWKFWIHLRETGATFHRVEHVFYIYSIRSKLNHVKLKARLISEQYSFFRDFRGHGKLGALMFLCGHIFVNVMIWLVVNDTIDADCEDVLRDTDYDRR